MVLGVRWSCQLQKSQRTPWIWSFGQGPGTPRLSMSFPRVGIPVPASDNCAKEKQGGLSSFLDSPAPLARLHGTSLMASPPEPAVLYVDDERSNTRVFELNF